MTRPWFVTLATSGPSELACPPMVSWLEGRCVVVAGFIAGASLVSPAGAGPTTHYDEAKVGEILDLGRLPRGQRCSQQQLQLPV